jgi:hypothetical protein
MSHDSHPHHNRLNASDSADPQPVRISQLVSTARRLRKTRAACRKFLALWALDQDKRKSGPASGYQEKQLADPMNHDWSLLYLGSILDD